MMKTFSAKIRLKSTAPDMVVNLLNLLVSMAVQNMPFIENMEKRILNANALLDTSLGHCFVDALEHRDENAIYNCLRAYAAIDNTKSAEEIFRSTVVAPLIQKVIPTSSSGVVDGASGDELEQDYERITQYIEDGCKFLLEISSRGIMLFFCAFCSLLYRGRWTFFVCALLLKYKVQVLQLTGMTFSFETTMYFCLLC